MANNIKGITIKIGGDTVNLNKALKDVNKSTYSLQSELTQVNRQLRFDPSNTELLKQKQVILKESIEASNNKLKELENLQQDIARAYQNGEIDDGQYRAFQREVEQTKSKIKGYEAELEHVNTSQRDFQKEVNESREVLNKNKNALAEGAKTAAKWGAAMSAAAVGGLIKITKDAADITDNVDKMSQKIDISRETYQELDFVFSQAGADVNILKNGLKTMRNVMDTTAKGTSKQATALEELGISATDSSGNLRSSEEVMWEAFSTLQKMTNQSKKAQLAAKLFGKSGTELLPMLNSSSKSIDQLRKKAHSLGLVLSDEAIDRGVEFKDTLDQTQRALQATGAELGASFMPAITKAFKKFQTHLPEIKKYAEGVGDAIGDSLGWLIDNGDAVIRFLKAGAIETAGIFTAIKAYNATKRITETIEAFQRLKNATEAAKIAQIGLNTAEKANVIGAVVSGLIILGTTLWSVYEATKSEEEAVNQLSKAETELNEKIDETTENQKKLSESRKKAFSEAENEFNYYTKLTNELDKITTRNGKVKKGYEERAKFITGTLSEATGQEIRMNNGVIESYRKIRSQIRKTIEQKRLAAQQSAFSDSYESAVKSKDSDYQDYSKKKSQLKERQNILDDLQKKRKKLQEQLNSAQGPGFALGDKTKKELGKIYGEIAVAEKNVNEAKSQVDAAFKAYINDVSMIENYEALSAAILSGNRKEINSALTAIKNDFVSAKNGTFETLREQVKNARTALKDIERAYKEGAPGIKKQDIKNHQELLLNAVVELQKYENAHKNSGKKAAKKQVDSYAETLNSDDSKAKISNAANNLTKATSSKDNKDRAKSSGKSLGKSFKDGFLETLKGAFDKAFDVGFNFTKSAVKGAKKGQKSNSPSKETKKLADDNADGFILNLQDREKEAFAAGYNFTRKAVAGARKGQKGYAVGLPNVNSTDYNAQINSRLSPLITGGAVTNNSSRVITNNPKIVVNLGGVSVRNNQDIDAIADRVTNRVSENLAEILVREEETFG